MNDSAVIKAFVDSQQTWQEPPVGSDPQKNGDPYLPALIALAQNSDWRQDKKLVSQVVSKLDTFEPKSPKACAQIVAIYRKLITPMGGQEPISLKTIQIKISDQKTINLPMQMLMAESTVLKRLLHQSAGQPLDLSEKASEECLTLLTDHLATGNTAFVNEDNAVELLLLAKEFGLSELTMKCLEQVLRPSSKALNQLGSGRLLSSEERDLLTLLEEAKANSITISKSQTRIAHIKISDGSKPEQWECLKKLHRMIPVTHLELAGSINLDRLLAFSKDNPDIISLSLRSSPGIDEVYLEKLSTNLPNLNSFSIQSNTIKYNQGYSTVDLRSCRIS